LPSATDIPTRPSHLQRLARHRGIPPILHLRESGP